MYAQTTYFFSVAVSNAETGQSRAFTLFYCKVSSSEKTLRLTRASFATFSLGGDARKVNEYRIAALCWRRVGSCRLGVVVRVATSRARDCNGYPAGVRFAPRGVEVKGPVPARRHAPIMITCFLCQLPARVTTFERFGAARQVLYFAAHGGGPWIVQRNLLPCLFRGGRSFFSLDVIRWIHYL